MDGWIFRYSKDLTRNRKRSNLNRLFSFKTWPHEIERNERDPKGPGFSRATVQSVVWEFDKTSARFHPKLPGKTFSTNPKLQKNSDLFLETLAKKRACLSVTQVKLIEIPTQRSLRTLPPCPPLVVQDVNAWVGWGGGTSSSCYSAGDEWKMC